MLETEFLTFVQQILVDIKNYTWASRAKNILTAINSDRVDRNK